jgi:hypothetical protein
MGRFIALLYGLPSYVVFLVTFLYAIGVVSGFVGYLLFVAVTTTYIVVGMLLGERDLVDLYCDEYRRYKDRVSIVSAPAISPFRGLIPHPTHKLCTLRVRRCRRLTQHSPPGGPLRLYLGRTCTC